LRLVVNEILPVAERFLETPEEKRLRSEQIELDRTQNALRRARRGTVVTAIGFAAALMFVVVGLASRDPVWLVPGIPSIIGFLVGAGILLNALFSTAPAVAGKHESKRPLEEILWGKKGLGGRRPQGVLPPKKETDHADSAADQPIVPSVTEGTTRHL
jgi:hypothetical protein